MIFRYKGRFLKVIKVRSRGDNNWTFDCKNLDTKKSQTLTLKLPGFLKALDKGLPAMKTSKDIFFLDWTRAANGKSLMRLS